MSTMGPTVTFKHLTITQNTKPFFFMLFYSFYPKLLPNIYKTFCFYRNKQIANRKQLLHIENCKPYTNTTYLLRDVSIEKGKQKKRTGNTK
jgi:hypothetical protein